MGDFLLENILEKSVLVVAHPDDEMLWFSSILSKVDSIVVCYLTSGLFSSLTEGRRKSISEYPLNNLICLNLNESDSFNLHNWIEPKISPFGLNLSASSQAKQLNYEKNYFELLEKLRERLAGARNVFTHNPWGEYGHEEHVQLFYVVKQLQQETEFNLWYPGYCSNKSFALMVDSMHMGGSKYIMLKTDKKLAREIEKIYRKNKCWTWYKEWSWMDHEAFIQYQANDISEEKYGYMFPLNMIKTECAERKEKESFSRYLLKKIQKKIHV